MTKRSSWVLFSVIGFAGVLWWIWHSLAVGGVDSELKSQIRCSLSGIPPVAKLTQSPLQVGTNWVTVDLPSTLPRIPHLEHVLVVLPGELYSYKHHYPRPEGYEGPGTSHYERTTGEEVRLEVTVRDEDSREVFFSNNTYSLLPDGQFDNPELGYGMTQSGWDKAYFAPDVKPAKVAIRANRPVTVHSVSWSASRYCFNPFRKWGDVPERNLYRFEDGPGPLGTKGESSQQSGVGQP